MQVGSAATLKLYAYILWGVSSNDGLQFGWKKDNINTTIILTFKILFWEAFEIGPIY